MDEQILTGFLSEIEKIGMSSEEFKAKMSQPPTGDTGPPGKGKNDPRFKANTGKGFEKKAMSAPVQKWIELLKSRT